MNAPEERVILSFSEDFTSNASLFIDGKIVASAAEERFNRKKCSAGFPEQSIKYCLSEAGINFADVDAVVAANKYHFVYRLFPTQFKDYNHDFLNLKQKVYMHYHGLLMKSPALQALVEWGCKALVQRQLGRKIALYDHHKTHAYSAYTTSGFPEALGVTIDNIGDGLSGGMFYCKDGKVRLMYGMPALASAGQFYGEITQFLGFNPLKHAGKVTGLAACGDPYGAYPLMMKLFSLSQDRKEFILPPLMTKSFTNGLYKELAKFSAKDIAAAAQRRLEDVVLEFVRHGLEQTGLRRLVLAGGVAGNVRMNQKLHELRQVDEIFVHPGMGDCGLSLGAGLMHLAESNGLKPFKLDTVYFGPEFDDAAVEKEFAKFDGVRVTKDPNIEDTVARLLADGKVVARFAGRMEYGPRALGNRTIMYQATDRTVNDWLNEKLKRTEFMPFAPVTLAEKAHECYLHLEGGEYTAKFMTIAFDCTDRMKKECPGVVHVDGTARPQLIYEQDNPSYYKIVQRYYELTGLSSVINTSFNMHEEPIVCTPFDALRAFTLGHLDYLAINNFLVENV
ncbi:MAG: carbamoyltransferase [Candidatus Coatesbacteria bacterium]|nr:carbamoyltransferase [Candidatus Coatesbacteria bacterium]